MSSSVSCTGSCSCSIFCMSLVSPTRSETNCEREHFIRVPNDHVTPKLDVGTYFISMGFKSSGSGPNSESSLFIAILAPEREREPLNTD